MSLVANLFVNWNCIGQMEIQRLRYLDLSDKAAIADEVCEYQVSVDGKPACRVTHRYGDGAWVLLATAAAAYAEGDKARHGKGRGQRKRRPEQ